eukprot:7376394-Prymnesium_polylepis.2
MKATGASNEKPWLKWAAACDGRPAPAHSAKLGSASRSARAVSSQRSGSRRYRAWARRTRTPVTSGDCANACSGASVARHQRLASACGSTLYGGNSHSPPAPCDTRRGASDDEASASGPAPAISSATTWTSHPCCSSRYEHVRPLTPPPRTAHTGRSRICLFGSPGSGAPAIRKRIGVHHPTHKLLSLCRLCLCGARSRRILRPTRPPTMSAPPRGSLGRSRLVGVDPREGPVLIGGRGGCAAMRAAVFATVAFFCPQWHRLQPRRPAQHDGLCHRKRREPSPPGE